MLSSVRICNAAPPEPPRPNVVFLAVDDMRDWVGCLQQGSGQAQTPNIDRLARRGVLFRNAHCASPKCAPSRAAIMTGLRPSTTGLYDNGHWWLPNLPDVVTIPNAFRQNGYVAAGAGKIFHHTAGNQPPNQWDEFHRLTFTNDPWFREARVNYPWSEHGPFPAGYPYSNVPGLGHENDWGALPIKESQYDDVHSVDFAIDFLDRDHDRPFFLACGLFRPHLPWYVPHKYFDLYPIDSIRLPPVRDDDLDDVPDQGRKLAADRRSDLLKIRDAERVRHAVQAYLASISFADAQLGRILDKLEANGLADTSIIVLWSDHGWHLGEKQHWHKSTLWEAATRVPLIIAAPGFESGECDAPVSLLDLYPTLVELAGIEFEADLDGDSLVALLRDPALTREQPAIIEYKLGNVAVRSARYRYIQYRDGGEELYDHQSDPNEWTNLADLPAHQATKAKLRRWATSHWAESARTKSAFDFDPKTFTWTEKKTGRVIRGDAP